jgi:hypothetical protein
MPLFFTRSFQVGWVWWDHLKGHVFVWGKEPSCRNWWSVMRITLAGQGFYWTALLVLYNCIVAPFVVGQSYWSWLLRTPRWWLYVYNNSENSWAHWRVMIPCSITTRYNREADGKDDSMKGDYILLLPINPNPICGLLPDNASVVGQWLFSFFQPILPMWMMHLSKWQTERTPYWSFSFLVLFDKATAVDYSEYHGDEILKFLGMLERALGGTFPGLTPIFLVWLQLWFVVIN